MSSTPKLVGLIGRKGAGKDTAAAVLLGKGYQNVKFAGALKGMLRNLLAYQGVAPEVVEEMVEGSLKEEPTVYLDGQTPRFAMQTLGTEWGRELIGDRFWINTTLRLVGDKNTVITDVRFPNEMRAVDQAGGICFGISADWIKPSEGEHESEALIDDLIASLPASQKVLNKRGAVGQEAQAIQAFQSRFLNRLNDL